jgi:hypothetical protein
MSWWDIIKAREFTGTLGDKYDAYMYIVDLLDKIEIDVKEMLLEAFEAWKDERIDVSVPYMSLQGGGFQQLGMVENLKFTPDEVREFNRLSQRVGRGRATPEETKRFRKLSEKGGIIIGEDKGSGKNPMAVYDTAHIMFHPEPLEAGRGVGLRLEKKDGVFVPQNKEQFISRMEELLGL